MPTPPPVLIGLPCPEGDAFIRSIRVQPDARRDDRLRRLLWAAKLAGIDIQRILKDIT